MIAPVAATWLRCERKLKQNIFIYCVLELLSWRKDLRENGGSSSLRGIEVGEIGLFYLGFLFPFNTIVLDRLLQFTHGKHTQYTLTNTNKKSK